MVTKQRVSSLSRGVRKDILEERVLAVSWLRKRAGTICDYNARPIKAASLVRQGEPLSTDRVGGWAFKPVPQKNLEAKAATRLKIRTGLEHGGTENPKR